MFECLNQSALHGGRAIASGNHKFHLRCFSLETEEDVGAEYAKNAFKTGADKHKAANIWQ